MDPILFISESSDGCESSDVTLVQLGGCLPFSTQLTEEIGASTLSLADIQALTAEELPTNLVVPLALSTESNQADSTAVVEECLLLLQTLAVTLRGVRDGITRQICFWTCNAEGPWVDSTEEGDDIAVNEYSSLVGASVWGMVRSASLEIDPGMLRMVCVDTDTSYNAMDGLNQVLQELHGTADNSKPSEFEICYRGNERFVRRLRESDHHIIGDVELTLNSRGSLENLVVSPSKAHAASIPDGSVEVAVHAVGLNFKDVLNVLVPNDAAYLGFDTPPLPGSDFAGIVTRIPETSTGSPFAIGDKVYGLSFDMLRSRSIVPVNSIAKVPSCLSFEEASALPMVFLTVLYALKDQAGLKRGDRILIHSAAGGVGSAAVQYAQFVGADVYATASPSKHEYLRSIGVSNVTTSRDEAVFEAEMGELVGGKGFDVVLSAGNLIDKSLDLLADGGCFLELGKRNILSSRRNDKTATRCEVFYLHSE